MSFIAPNSLYALVIVPLLVFLYWQAVRRGHSSGHVWYPGVEIFRAKAPRRTVGVGLYFAAITMLVLALARPQAVVMAPDDRAIIMLAIDVSGSMRATDIHPTRLDAAKAAAKSFMEKLPSGIKVGLVSFAGYAQLESPPTSNRAQVIAQIELLQRRYNTAIGEGLVQSLAAFPEDSLGQPDDSATIILLSDGQNRTGIPPQEAAQQARAKGVRVHTIGVGGSNPDPDMPFMGFDEAELKGIAQTTGGRYFAVNSAERLLEVYRELGRQIAWRPQKSEITALISLSAAVMLAFSLLLANWSRRVV